MSTLPTYGAPITLAQATQVAAAAEAEAAAQGWRMAIAIVDSGGHLVLFHKMDQTQLGSVPIAQRKAETAVAFRKPTLAFEQTLSEGGANLRLLAADNILPIEGGLPLMADGLIIGGIGISGGASADDGRVAQAGAAAII